MDSIKVCEEQISFYTIQRNINETRVEIAGKIILSLEDKFQENPIKINADCLKEMKERQDVLKEWVVSDNKKIQYYQSFLQRKDEK